MRRRPTMASSIEPPQLSQARVIWDKLLRVRRAARLAICWAAAVRSRAIRSRSDHIGSCRRRADARTACATWGRHPGNGARGRPARRAWSRRLPSALRQTLSIRRSLLRRLPIARRDELDGRSLRAVQKAVLSELEYSPVCGSARDGPRVDEPYAPADGHALTVRGWTACTYLGRSGRLRLRPTARLPTCTDDSTAHSSPAKCCDEDPACAPWAKGLLRRDG